MSVTIRTRLNRVIGGLRGLFQKSRVERDLDEELREHLAAAVEHKMAAGMTELEATRAARVEVGSLEAAKDWTRDAGWESLVESCWQDLRYAVRVLRQSPGFTAVAVLSLAIGIGANTAVFSFADALLLRPLAVPRPAQLLTVGSPDPARESSSGLTASYRDYVDIRDRSQSFEGLVAFTTSAVGVATGPASAPKPGIGMLVTDNFFPVVGVEPRLGRNFRPEENEVPGRDAVVVLGHDFWEQQFGADPAVLGRTVKLSGVDFTVIGVAPPGFTGLDQYARFQFYAPLMMWPRLITGAENPFEARGFRRLTLKGRLKSGVTIAEAQTELTVLATDLERAHPDTNRKRRLTVRTELQNRVASVPIVPSLLVMLTMLAAAVLLVACANVAGLLTSRAPVRAREIAMRLAIGAGRGRVVRQLVTENALVALLGGVLGLGVGYAAVTLFSQIRIPTDLPIVAAFELDRRALLVSLIVALASVVFFGLAPAIRSTRTDLTSVMKATDAGTFGGRRWGRSLLVGGQVAISVVLLVIATFTYRSFEQLLGAGPGFPTDRLLMMNVAPGEMRYSRAQTERFFEQLVERARLVPGVKTAGLTRYAPMDGGPPTAAIVPEGFQFPPGIENAVHASSAVDEAYFDTIGLPIIKGRPFLTTDSADAPQVAVVNEVLAQKYWPGQDPIGKRFRLFNADGPWVEVVGLAKTSRYGFIWEAPTEFVYFPFRQRPPQGMFLLVRSLGDPGSLAAPLREVVHGLDANLPIFNVRTMEELYRLRSVVIVNVITTLIAAMGLMGLALAIVGLYGLVAYGVSRRTREIGIRMAIGAGRFDVLRMVLGQGLVLAVAGLGVGLLASFGASLAMTAVFPDPSGGAGRTDYVAFPLVAVTVLAVTLLAAYLPARRASRVNPTEALRCD